MRRSSWASFGGPVFTEVRSALYQTECRAPVINWIYGLGGRDFDLRQGATVIEAIDKVARGEEMDTVNLLGVRLRGGPPGDRLHSEALRPGLLC